MPARLAPAGETDPCARAVERAERERRQRIEAAERLKTQGRRSHREQILSRPGELAARFAFESERFPDPVLVTAGADADRRLRLGLEWQQLSLPAQDLVNACTNRVAAQGATPLMFTATLGWSVGAEGAGADRDASGAEMAAALAEALRDACKGAGCAFPDLETSLLAPSAQPRARLSGVAVGAGSRSRLLVPDRIAPDDVLLALPSRALQNTELELARALILDRLSERPGGLRPDRYSNDLGEKPIEALLRPQRSFVALARKLLQAEVVSGLIPVAGSVADTLDRALPKGTAAHIRADTWPVPPVFRCLTALGGMEKEQAWQLLSMGIGLIACIPPPLLGKAQRLLSQCHEAGFVIGQVLRPQVSRRLELL